MRLVLLLLILTTGVHAASLPASTPNLANIIQGFRPKFATMVSNLKVNFIYDLNKNVAHYYSNKRVKCGRKSVKAGKTLAKIFYSYKQSENQLKETIRYNGCFDDPMLIEEIESYGDGLAPMGIAKVMTGNLDFSMKKLKARGEMGLDFDFSKEKNITKKIYRLRDIDGNVIFQSNEEIISENKKTLQIFILGIRVLFQTITKSENKIEANHVYHWETMNYKFSRGIRTDHNMGEPGQVQIYLMSSKKVPLLILEDGNRKMTEQEMLEGFTGKFLAYVVKVSKNITDSFVGYMFPKTELVDSGGSNNRFLNEMIRMRIQLESGSQANLNLARQTLIRLINDIQKGTIGITDNREN